ncbi:MAG: hypothetical protein H5T44_01525 [Thermoplasmatales archaeon]|nr:hypothetical protein [Thermoplasmatales archaeon]
MRKVAIVAFVIFILFLFFSAYEMRDFGKPQNTEMDDRIIGKASEIKIERNNGELIFSVDNEEKILQEGINNISIAYFKFYFDEGRIKIILNNETVDEIGEDELPYKKIFWVYGAVKETGADNAVTSVVFDYRGYDTLGEATILFSAIAGVLTLFRREKNE